MKPEYRYRATCERVIDGDTFLARIDLGFYVGVEIRIRVHGVNAPELKTLEGKEARGWALDQLLDQPLIIESYKDERSFERWVCDVYIDGKSYADMLIDAGHGTPMVRK